MVYKYLQSFSMIALLSSLAKRLFSPQKCNNVWTRLLAECHFTIVKGSLICCQTSGTFILGGGLIKPRIKLFIDDKYANLKCPISKATSRPQGFNIRFALSHHGPFLLRCSQHTAMLSLVPPLFSVVSPVSALLHFLNVFPFATSQASPSAPRRPLLQPQWVAVLLQRAEGGAHGPKVVLVVLAGLDAVAALPCRILAGSGLRVQLSVWDQLQRDPDERVGEVRVLLSHADVNAGVGRVEGANQETSIGVHDAIVQLDLGDKKKKGGGVEYRLKFMKHQTGSGGQLLAIVWWWWWGGLGVNMWVCGGYSQKHQRR